MLCCRSATIAGMCQTCHRESPPGYLRRPRMLRWLRRRVTAVVTARQPDPRPASNAQCSPCGPPHPRRTFVFWRGLSCSAVGAGRESWRAPFHLVSAGCRAAAVLAAYACLVVRQSKRSSGDRRDRGRGLGSALVASTGRGHRCCVGGSSEAR
jgi:hypothetical protein